MTLTSGEPALQVAATGERLERGAVSTLKASDDWMHVCVVVFVEVGIVALLADSLFHRPESFASVAVHVEHQRAAGRLVEKKRGAQPLPLGFRELLHCGRVENLVRYITFTHVQGVLTFTCTYLHRPPRTCGGSGARFFRSVVTRVEREGCRDADGGKKIREVERGF